MSFTSPKRYSDLFNAERYSRLTIHNLTVCYSKLKNDFAVSNPLRYLRCLNQRLQTLIQKFHNRKILRVNRLRIRHNYTTENGLAWVSSKFRYCLRLLYAALLRLSVTVPCGGVGGFNARIFCIIRSTSSVVSLPVLLPGPPRVVMMPLGTNTLSINS